MSFQILEETSATDHESIELDQVADSMSAAPLGAEVFVGLRPALLMAGFVLAAAMNSGPSIAPMTHAGTKRRDELVSDSSTVAGESDPELLAQVRDLFELGASEFFEDGLQSNFSRALLWTLAQHGRRAFDAVAEYVASEPSNPDVVSEALRWMGEIKDPCSLTERWAILRRSLRNSSPRVRDGAILGFAALDDPRARGLLLETRDIERIGELRRLIDLVIAQLEATANGAASPHSPTEQMA